MSNPDHVLWRQVVDRLVREGQWLFTRGDQDPPNFKGASVAAKRVLDAYPHVRTVLVHRPVVLRPACELALERGLNLIMPTKIGPEVFQVPRDALLDAQGHRLVDALKIQPPPRGSQIYNGQVDLIVVGCLGFNPASRRLYNHDNERAAYLVDEWRRGLDNGFRVPKSVPVVAIAADCQEVHGWPEGMRSFLAADYVFTPTKTLRLGHQCSDGQTMKEEKV